MPAPRKTPAKTTPAKAVAEEVVTETKPTSEETASFDSVEKDSLKAELEAAKAELEAARAEIERAKTNPTDTEGRPLSEDQLTPEQREIRALQDQLAVAKGADLEAAQEVAEEVNDEGFLIHILEDGLTAAGRVLYRGEEILFGPAAYEETKDRFGNSWLNMSDEAQYDRWGTVKFRKGPWPGKKNYEEASLANASIRSVASTIRI